MRSPSRTVNPDARPDRFGATLRSLAGIRDFRLLWIGAFLSFTGSWIQNVAQGYFVYQLTHDESKLAMVNFAWSMPVTLFGLFAGTLADTLHKRRVLVVTHIIYTVLTLLLAVMTFRGTIQYWMIPAVSLVMGLTATIEMPARQSIVSRVVPAEDLAVAVPINAMTFNVARIFGPALGGVMLARMGVPACYLVNAISFVAVIWSAMAMRGNLGPSTSEPQPIRDLLMEGLLYTFRDHRLRALFILETVTAAVGIAYLPQLPAVVEQILQPALHTPAGLDPDVFAKQWLGYAYTAVGVGSLAGLLIITRLANSAYKGRIVQGSMWIIALSLPALAVAHSPFLVFPLLALLGMAAIAQFNTTNALFQLLSPERLRGRVLAMHIWALNGLAPFGVLAFGAFANATKVSHTLSLGGMTWRLPMGGVPMALMVAGVLMVLGAIGASLSSRGLSNLHRQA